MTTPALAALRAAVAAGPLPVRRTDTVRTRVAPTCGRGRLTLAIVHRRSGEVVARGSRTIASAGSHAVRLRPTRAARRLAGQGPVVLRLRVRFAPAG